MRLDLLCRDLAAGTALSSAGPAARAIGCAFVLRAAADETGRETDLLISRLVHAARDSSDLADRLDRDDSRSICLPAARKLDCGRLNLNVSLDERRLQRLSAAVHWAALAQRSTQDYRKAPAVRQASVAQATCGRIRAGVQTTLATRGWVKGVGRMGTYVRCPRDASSRRRARRVEQDAREHGILDGLLYVCRRERPFGGAIVPCRSLHSTGNSTLRSYHCRSQILTCCPKARRRHAAAGNSRSRLQSRRRPLASDTARLIMEARMPALTTARYGHGHYLLQTWQITHGHVPRASWQQCVAASVVHRSRSGRAAEQNKDRAAQARAGRCWRDHDSCQPCADCAGGAWHYYC